VIVAVVNAVSGIWLFGVASVLYSAEWLIHATVTRPLPLAKYVPTASRDELLLREAQATGYKTLKFLLVSVVILPLPLLLLAAGGVGLIASGEIPWGVAGVLFFGWCSARFLRERKLLAESMARNGA